MSKLRAVQKDTFPDYSEQLALDIYGFQHSFVYLSLSEQRTLNESGIHFFKIEKKKNTTQISTCTVSMALAPGTGLLSWKEDQHWSPRKEGV